MATRYNHTTEKLTNGLFAAVVIRIDANGEFPARHGKAFDTRSKAKTFAKRIAERLAQIEATKE